MLPIVVPAHAWTLAVLSHTAALVAISLVPLWYGMGLVYGLGAGVGGAIFLWKSVELYFRPTTKAAMANFFASLLQLTLLIAGVLLDGVIGLGP
jgi:protoheme IX farnesyltransferase